MAAKKKGLFDTISTESVYDAIAEATAEPAAELPPGSAPQKQKREAHSGRNPGRKGTGKDARPKRGKGN